MKSFVVMGFAMGIYSAILTAIYLHFRKEKIEKGICIVWEVVKWLIWCGAAMFLALAAMQYGDEYFQLNLNKEERSCVLSIWLTIIWGYIGLVGYSAWKKRNCKSMIPQGKLSMKKKGNRTR